MGRLLKLFLFRAFPAFLVLGAFVYGFNYLVSTKPVVEQTRLKEKVWSVDVSPVSIKDAQPEFVAYSTVKSMRQVNLQLPLTGVVKFISPNFKEGAILKKGELLVGLEDDRQILALEDTDTKIKAEKINVSYLQKQSELRLKIANRIQKMKERSAATDASLDEAKLSVVITENQLAQTEARILELEILRKKQIKDIDDTQLIAPFTGSLSKVSIASGQRVTNASTIGVLTELNAKEVPFIVPAEVFVKLDSLLNSEVTLIWKSGDDDLAISKGIIKRYQSEIDKIDGGGTLYAELEDNSSNFIPVGAFVEVVYKGFKLNKVVMLPESALYANEKVYAVINGRTVARNVEIKYRSDGKIWVSGELEENDLIIATRLLGLSADMKVKINQIIDVD